MERRTFLRMLGVGTIAAMLPPIPALVQLPQLTARLTIDDLNRVTAETWRPHLEALFEQDTPLLKYLRSKHVTRQTGGGSRQDN